MSVCVKGTQNSVHLGSWFRKFCLDQKIASHFYLGQLFVFLFT